MKIYKRINEPLMKNGMELFAIGDTSNEIIGDENNWEVAENKSVYDLKRGDCFWLLDFFGDVDRRKWDDTNHDKRRRSIGNAYLTKEEAEEARWKLEFEEKMRKDFKPWECEWGDVFEHKYCIYCDIPDEEINIDANTVNKYQGVIYCKNEEVVKKFIKENENDLLRYFGVNNER